MGQKISFDLFPWTHFAHGDAAFTKVGADRFSVLLDLVHEAGLVDKAASPAVRIDRARHIFIQAERINKKKTVFLSAHYDCTPGSPGANDNGAAVFILLEAALLLRAARTPDWVIIFTDKEELCAGESLEKQGAYKLASGLKKTGWKGNPCFIFDTVGRGDTLIISTTARYLLKNSDAVRWSAASLETRRAVEDLNYRALEAARKCCLSGGTLLPTPFSDDAGFFLAGFPAQLITALPREEAAFFQQEVRLRPDIIPRLGSQSAAKSCGLVHYPKTWRLINSPDDSADTLSPENFSLVRGFACALCERAG